jgi:hypothetical protein
MAAKVMFGGTCIEGVGTQIVSSLEQGESGGGHDEMDKAFFAADRTIAFGCFELFDLNSITNFATMTAAVISCRSIHDYRSKVLILCRSVCG